MCVSSDDDEDEHDTQKKAACKASKSDQKVTNLHGEAASKSHTGTKIDRNAADGISQQLQPQLLVEKPEADLERSECEVVQGDEEEIPVASVNFADIQAPAMPVDEERSESEVALSEIVDGPLQVDLLLSSTSSSARNQPQLDTSDEEDALEESISGCPDELNEDEELTQAIDESVPLADTSEAQVNGLQGDEHFDDDDISEYSRSLATRRHMHHEDRHREQLRGELESYVELLTSRKGEDGAQLVEFPRNYQQVLSLMSERDVRDEDASTTAGSGGSTQRSWSHVLIQAGLSKQQAFVSMNCFLKRVFVLVTHLSG